MYTEAEFQIVCCGCGRLEIKNENPEKASRETIVYCGYCGVPRGTVGALRDLAVRASPQPMPKVSGLPSKRAEDAQRNLGVV